MGNQLEEILEDGYEFNLSYYPNIVSAAVRAISKGVPLCVRVDDLEIYIDPIQVVKLWDNFALALAELIINSDTPYEELGDEMDN